MKIIESIKLKLRADKYKTKHDIGGIAYINASVQRNQTVLDIGAHKGGYLYFILKRVGEQGKVYAFEPQFNLYSYLVRMKKLFKWDNAVIEHLALSNSIGDATLFIPTNKVSKGSSPGATLVEHKERSDFKLNETVKVDTLDHYCQRNNISPDFLKIDVEGNELNIFKGGTDVLKKYKPKILVEIEKRHIGPEQVFETFKFLESLGYTGQFIHRENRVSLANFDLAKHQNLEDMDNYCNNFIFE